MFLLFALITSSQALVYTNLVGARVNPLGALEQLKLTYRNKYLDSTSPVLEPASVQVSAITNITPAYVRAGPMLEWMPLAVLNLSVALEGIGYFGTFQNVFSRPSAFAPYSDAARAASKDAYSTYGTLLTFGALLQGKVGPVALRSQLQVVRADMRLRKGDRVWYDALSDMLVPANGYFLMNDADLVYMTTFGLIAGARYSLGHTFTGGPGEQQRVGPLLVYQFADRGLFAKPCLILLTQWFLQHPYRAGELQSQALPQVTVAFSFQGEISLRKE